MKGKRIAEKRTRAWVLIKAESGQALKAAAKIQDLSVGAGNAIGSPDVVIGPYDIVVPVNAKSVKALTNVIVNEIQAVTGVKETLTLLVAEHISSPTGIVTKGFNPWG
jgi:DNA-binding Lrp family transcriptional regulator